MNRRLSGIFLIVFSFSSWMQGETALDKQKAVELFEKLKQQEGLWRGKSTKGWENREVVKVIAKGSVVMATSEFIDSPGEGMVTMFFMDGDQLRLTHYCEAGNQPMLTAASVGTNGAVTFEFSGGTNLPDRNKGHMDKVIIRFIDNNHYTSQWTWYSKGQERWLENVEYERLE